MVENGEVVNVIWAHRDVTERQQEERLLELRNRALNYMSDGIFICDRQGSMLYTNQGFARLTGYEQREAVGRPWSFLAVRPLVLLDSQGTVPWIKWDIVWRVSKHRGNFGQLHSLLAVSAAITGLSAPKSVGYRHAVYLVRGAGRAVMQSCDEGAPSW